MGSFTRGLGLGAVFVALFAATIQAQAASTFFLERTETQFSLNLANGSSDVNIYFTSPAFSWVGVGFGAGMKNSLMVLLYPNKNGDNVTVSPRIADGNSEPSFAPEIKLDILEGTGIFDDMFVVKAVCRSCRVWRGGIIDTSNTAHPMIYAFGPGNSLYSDDPNVSLKRHTRYGKFNMNMVEATGQGEIPASSSSLKSVKLTQGPVKDHHRKSLAHSVLGCLALFVLWPLNVLFAGFLRNIRIHVGMSIFIMAFLVISFGLGISISSEFNRSKSFNSPHQILAFIAIAPMLLLSLLPLKPLAALHAKIPRLHTPLTTLTFTLLVLTGGLGLRLGSAANPIILAYISIALLVFVFLTLIQLCIKRRGSAYARATTRRRLGEEDERDFGLAKWGVKRKIDSTTGGGSPDSRTESQTQLWERDHGRSPSAGSAGSRSPYGGGTMPGPQYLLNMHPGVPVHKWPTS
ncbi:iron reductase domain protein [Lentithecium fluviatile CBS 122367]|uniref:Iron reductase domain protein n=1 Tax=Lentithecium fluviatile CBS 122367 TaxID=1168545 RepID=A0A6G1ITZ1_9PLEO|nr:iron reductase domain protein [Lentithecium fluviatile CBS 122367]